MVGAAVGADVGALVGAKMGAVVGAEVGAKVDTGVACGPQDDNNIAVATKLKKSIRNVFISSPFR